jgi:predicted GNAT family acetyltransferase
MSELVFHHDTQRKRYTATRDGAEVAYLDVDPIGADAYLLKHTEVKPSEEGKGYGSAIVRSFFEYLRAGGKKVIPICPYAAGYIRKHPEYRDIVRP